MLNLTQILEITLTECQGLMPIIKLLRDGIMPIFQIGVPILLIVFGSIDLGKAVMSSDDKEIKGATGKLIKRAIAAVVIFFIPFLVNLVMSVVASTSGEEAGGTTNFANCWFE